MSTALVTIGLPFYNAENTLSLAIKSVLAQTFSEWNLLLVDDGSTDLSLDIAREFVRYDSRIQVLTDGKNRGLIYRLNQLIDLGDTKYIARMDADDMMLPEKLTQQVDFLENNPDIDIVDTAIYTMDEKTCPVGIRSTGPISLVPKMVLKKAMLVHATILARTEWFKQHHYDDKYVRAEDYELWCRTFAHSRFARISAPLYIVREGRVNITNYKKSLRTVRKIFRKYGPGILSPSELRTEILKTHLKIWLYSLAGGLRLQHYVSAKRNRPLDRKTTLLLKERIRVIKNFCLSNNAI